MKFVEVFYYSYSPFPRFHLHNLISFQLNLTLEAKSEPCSASDQSDDEDELIYDASFDRLNPGEVSDEAESESVNCNQRMLNFGSKINNNADLVNILPKS